MEVEVGIEMEVEVEMLVDRKLKNVVVRVPFFNTWYKHGRGVRVLVQL